MAGTRVRLGTVKEDGGEHPVLVRDDGLLPLDEALDGAPSDLRGLVAAWRTWSGPVRALADGGDAGHRLLRAEKAHWCAPLIPPKLLCVGSNYRDHVAEMEGPAGVSGGPPPFPYSFLKPASALVGSGREVRHPSYGRKLDWEAELAVVIGDGREARGPDPLDAVFGYTILNDLSLRDFLPFPHALGLDAIASKGFDGAAPMGPWITLREDVPDPQDLPVELTVNGEPMQRSTTANMIFGVRELIVYFARVLTLEPGDVIATGTPAGVGAGRRPPRFLAPGDRVEARIGELGSLETMITAPVRKDPLLPDSEGGT